LKTKLEAMMDEKGMSKTDLSKKSKVSLSYIHEITKRQKSPTVRTLGKLATALGVPVSALLDEPSTKVLGE